MGSQDVVEATRAALAPVGFQMPSIGLPTVPPVADQRDAVRRLEAAGYRNGWANEGVGAKDVFVQISILLAESERMTFGTSVTPMWARPPMVLHAAARQLNEAYPGRFVLGLGSGYAFMPAMLGLDAGRPLAKLREYVGRMAEATPIIESPAVNYATILGANGPKSIVLAGEVADGAIPSLVPPWYVAEARNTLGPHKLLVVGLITFIDDDEDAARAAASQTAAQVTSFPGSPYAKAMASFGYTQEERETGAERLINDITAYGSAESIAAAAQRFLDAGADHVVLQPAAADFTTGVDRLESIAPTVTSLTR